MKKENETKVDEAAKEAQEVKQETQDTKKEAQEVETQATEEVNEWEKKYTDLNDSHLRLMADFDNYRKRNQTLGEEMKQLGISMVVEKLLGVLDNCDLARKYISDESALQGFNMMETQILMALDTFGLKEVEAEGMAFDAKVMNALEREKAEGKEEQVVAVISKGYTLNGKLIRPAGVRVGY